MILAAAIIPAYSQTNSRVVGTVKDQQTGEPLIGANVLVVGTKLGAITDVDGRYFIINVPVGTYGVQASMLGYSKKTVVDVIVSADRVASVDFSLSSETIETQEVIVTADRGKLNKEVTGSQLVVTNDQLVNSVGIREVNTFLEKQPGVTKENGFLTIRGGSADQTGTMLNGISFNNAATGNAETSIPMSAIEQISLLSGGYNAEYGNFRSGLINVVTKSGSKEQYRGTVSYSRNLSHMKRFGPKFNDTKGPLLQSYLDPDVAFVGVNSLPNASQYLETFDGWIKVADTYNANINDPRLKVTPLDLYLFAAWMHLAIPDYAGLQRNGILDTYLTTDSARQFFNNQKKLFEEHALQEEGSDYNLDFGFGGPVPLLGEYLGDATFYISHNSRETHYIMPVTRRTDFSSVTLATIKSNPSSDLTLKLNGLYKLQQGISPIRPPFGDFPDASRDGGFMQEDNLSKFSRFTDGNYYGQWWDMSLYPELEERTYMGGVTMNYVFTPSTFSEATVSYLSLKDFSPTGDNRNNTVLARFGPILVSEMPYGRWQYAGSTTGSGSNVLTIPVGDTVLRYTHAAYDAVPGINAARRFRGKEGDLYTNVHTQQYRVKFDLSSQLDPNNYLKTGFEHNQYDINHDLWEKWNNAPQNAYEYKYHRKPSQTGIFIQDQMSYQNVIANLGVRFDYYYGGGGKWPSGDPYTRAFDPLVVGDSIFAILATNRSVIWEFWERWDAQQHPDSTILKPVKNFSAFSPRLGVSFPITEDSKFYFNYGHFRSSPPYYSMYLLRYRYTKNGLYNTSNPNLEPPKTIQYELGVAYNFYDAYIATLSAYSKDVTGQPSRISYVDDGSTSRTLDYTSWLNNNYQDVQGLELNISKNDNSWLSGWLNFNYMIQKTGNSGLSQESKNGTANLYYTDQGDNRALPIPRASANISFRSPELWGSEYTGGLDLLGNWMLSFFAEWKTGRFFTWNPSGELYVSNNLQWPDYYMMDVRLNRDLTLFGLTMSFYVDIKNIFNMKVNRFSDGFAFNENTTDYDDYLKSLRLPMYNSPKYAALRGNRTDVYIPGVDRPGDLNSTEKPYINNPDFTYWYYTNPRDIWFGIRLDF